MADLISPGSQTNEIDQTQYAVSNGRIAGAYSGFFTWGPCEEPTLVSSEEILAKSFGKPVIGYNHEGWWTSQIYLTESTQLLISRAYNSADSFAGAVNFDGTTQAQTTATPSALNTFKNYDDFLMGGVSSTANIVARYPGVLGNGISVCLIDAVNYNSDVVNGTTATSKFTRYKSLFNSAPTSSDSAIVLTAEPAPLDEIHVLIIDTLGSFGDAGEVLEKYSYLSKIPGAKDLYNNKAYWIDVINEKSKYVYIPAEFKISTTTATTSKTLVNFVDTDNDFYDDMLEANSYSANTITVNPVTKSVVKLNVAYVADTAADNAALSTWLTTNATALKRCSSFSKTSEVILNVAGGTNGTETISNILTAQKYFEDNQSYDIRVLMNGNNGPVAGNDLLRISDSVRKDCVALISPRLSYNTGDLRTGGADALAFAIAERAMYPSTSYGFMDSNWAMIYDKYNDTNIWVPCNGFVGAIIARTDKNAAIYYSPAGFNRGKLLGIIKLAWVQPQTIRDGLYKNSINPVTTFKGEGTILFGDKTLQSKPSAFDRINVRFAFIDLELVIGRAANYNLFEFNDELQRLAFINVIEPPLKRTKAGRGISDYFIKCDGSNNTAAVVEAKQFVGEISIKPNYSINFITLNFVAVGQNVSFNIIQ